MNKRNACVGPFIYQQLLSFSFFTYMAIVYGVIILCFLNSSSHWLVIWDSWIIQTAELESDLSAGWLALCYLIMSSRCFLSDTWSPAVVARAAIILLHSTDVWAMKHTPPRRFCADSMEKLDVEALNVNKVYVEMASSIMWSSSFHITPYKSNFCLS